MLESPKSHRIPPVASAEAAPLPPGSDLALCVYAESALAVQGRRGIVIGPADAGVADRLLELGARSIHLFDPIAARAESVSRGELPRGLTVRHLDDRALDFRDNAFDFALVLELADVPSPPLVLTQIRRILERSAALLVRTRASGGIEYADLFDVLSLEFPYVTMIAEVPFGGLAFAELGAEAPEVSVDTQLAETPAPRAYFALAAHEPRTLDSYSIVQLPSTALDAGASLDVARELSEARELEDAETVARLTGEIYALREELDREGEKGMRLAMELETTEKRAQEEKRLADAHAHEAKRLADARVAEEKRIAEARVAEAMQASQEASVALQKRLATDLDDKLQAAQFDLATRLADAESLLVETEAQLLVQDAQVVRLSNDLIAAKNRLDIPTVDAKVAEDLSARLARTERKFAEVETELGQLAGEHVNEVSSLEAQLLDRARMLKAQDIELARRATMVEDLLSALEEVHAGATVSLSERPSQEDARLVEMKRALDEMSVEIARREGELESRGWRIKELELERELLVDAAKKLEGERAELFAVAERLEAERHELELAAKNAPAPAAPPPPKSQPAALPPSLQKLEDELVALRQALVQEHAARLSARDELERQARHIEELESKHVTRSSH